MTGNVNKDGVSTEADAARARAIVDALSKGQSSAEEVFAAFEELDSLDPEAVRDALRPWTGPAPDPAQLDDAIRRAHGLPPPPLSLRHAAVVRDADVLDLGPVAEEQLRIAGKTWDGVDLPPEDRLDGEREDSFAGTLEHHALVEAETGRPMFDVLLYAGDAGVVFRAGTTELVGTIAYGRVEMKDRRVRVAIEEALASPVEETPLVASEPEPVGLAGAEAHEEDRSEPAAAVTESTEASEERAAAPEDGAPPPATVAEEEEAASQKAASKKPAKKKAGATKKTAATKKSAAKKTTAKKTATKKPAAKKATTKKATAKKAAATKKPAAKKAATKKASAKKATTKKTATAKKAGATKKAAKTKAATRSKRAADSEA